MLVFSADNFAFHCSLPLLLLVLVLPTTPWKSAMSGVTPLSASPPEAPTASTEWSVVVSKIKKAPKQVRDQLKPPEKKPVVHAKPKTKMEKILQENPKFKSTLCSWWVERVHACRGARAFRCVYVFLGV